MIEKGLFQLIGTAPTVQALVPADVAGTTQIYWVLAQKGAVLPYIVLSRVGTGDTYTMNGATGFRDGLFQANCFATSFYKARYICTAVRQLLDSYQGTLPDVDQTVVDAVITEKDFDLQYQEGGKGWVFQAVYQFRCWYYDNQAG
jgi:hypothetical protein